MLTHATPQLRPYWHVDAKWITGILLFCSLGSALYLYNLANLTTRDTAVNLSATIMASLFSKSGLDDEAGAAALRQQTAQSPADVVAPIPQFPTITLTKEQVAGLSARDLELAIFSQITGPIYDQGLAIAASTFTNDVQQRGTFIQQAAPLGFLTASTHDLLQKLFLFSGIMSIVLLLLVAYYSAGWGRLVSPGVVLLTVSLIGTLLAIGLLNAPSGSGSLLANVPVTIINEARTSLSHSYIYATIAGAALLIIAALGKIISSIIGHSTSKSTLRGPA